MRRQSSKSRKVAEQQGKRLELIGRVQLAYEQVRDAMAWVRDGVPQAGAALRAARLRLGLLNRALAMLAVESSAQMA